MGAETAISWTAVTGAAGASWNVTDGCSRTAAEGATTSGCGDNTGGGCYAERTAGRFCGPGMPYDGLVRLTAKGPRWTGTVRLRAARLRQPLQWRRPRGIFTCSTSDPFHDELTDAELDQWVAVVGMAGKIRGHTFITLTKRAARMRRYINDSNNIDTSHPLGPLSLRLARAARAIDPVAYDKVGGHDFHWHPSCWPWAWFGVSAEHQLAADERIPQLLEAAVAVHLVSCEPLIGPVDLSRWLYSAMRSLDDAPLDWVIAGCESGPGSRPTELAWLRQLRDQCAAASVPYFLKQAIETVTDDELVPDPRGGPVGGPDGDGFVRPIEAGAGSRTKQRGVVELPYLDGVQHAAFPEPMEILR